MLDATIPLQGSGGSGGAILGGIVLLVIVLFLLALQIAKIAGRWKVFEKAGEPGWAAAVPLYNVYVMMEVAERPGWWTILSVIPLLALLPLVQGPHDVAKRFGKGWLYSVGLVFLPFVFWPMLGFGDASYQPDAF